MNIHYHLFLDYDFIINHTIPIVFDGSFECWVDNPDSIIRVNMTLSLQPYLTNK